MAERKYWNEEMEAISKKDLHRIETDILVKQLHYISTSSPFYKNKFEGAGINPEDIKSREDIVKLPFTTKEELRRTQSEDGGLGEHQCAPFTSIVRVQGTSGTSGRPLYVGLTEHDAGNWKELFARHAWAGGLRPGDSFINPADFTLFVGGLSESISAEAMGVCVIPAPVTTIGIEKIMELVLDLKPTVLFATPSASRFLADYVREEIKRDPRELSFTKGFMTGESLLEESRKSIEEEWGIVARNFYGLADVAADLASECGESEGMHFCGQGMVMAELIDPDTLEPIAMADGAEGEIVYTTIDRQATTVIRYRSGDIVRVYTSSCPCGRTSFRFTVLGRTENVLTVEGVHVYPDAVRDVIVSFIPETTGEFRIVLYGPEPVSKEDLEIEIEHGENLPPERIDGLGERVKEAMREKLVFTPVTKIIPPNSLERVQNRVKFFERGYEKKRGIKYELRDRESKG
jgi:phenylacetate-CoA ligase